MKRIALILALFASSLFGATSVTRNGITWTFNADYTVGQYANGDYYVVAPSGLTITNIDPLSVVVASRNKLESPFGTVANTITNGTMVNPASGTYPGQGFDSGSTGYSAALNAGRPGGNDLSGANPLVVAAGSSVLSGRSNVDVARPALTDAAVLTVVASAPAAGSFRPPYCGTDKTHYWNKSSIDYTKLSNKAAVTGTPDTDLAGVESAFAKVWIDFYTSNDGRYTHASNNQPEYGGNMARQVASAVVALNMSASDAAKEAAAVNFIQYGIDVYGAAKGGGNWYANGGHNIGRKPALLVAGILLNDAAILAYGDYTVHNIFSEDQQTFTVDAHALTVTPYNGDGRGRRPYVEGTITFNAGSANINFTGGPFYDNDRVKLTNTGGSLPTEGNTSDVYIVQSVSGSVMRLAASNGGTQIVFSGAGTGTHKATMIGVPEWGEQHASSETRDSSAWGTYYRDVCFREVARAAMGGRLVTGFKDAWNNQAFFDYCDIVMRVDTSGGNFSTWFRNFYAAYRYGGGSPPSTPSALASSLPSFTGGTLTWSDNSSGANEESYYEIQMSTTGGGAGFSTLMTVPANIGTGTMTQALSALPSGRTRYFRVRAVNAADVSAWSSEVSLTTWNLGAPPKNRSPRKVFTR